jgi:hypothetical protein
LKAVLLSFERATRHELTGRLVNRAEHAGDAARSFRIGE